MKAASRIKNLKSRRGGGHPLGTDRGRGRSTGIGKKIGKAGKKMSNGTSGGFGGIGRAGNAGNANGSSASRPISRDQNYVGEHFPPANSGKPKPSQPVDRTHISREANRPAANEGNASGGGRLGAMMKGLMDAFGDANEASRPRTPSNIF